MKPPHVDAHPGFQSTANPPPSGAATWIPRRRLRDYPVAGARLLCRHRKPSSLEFLDSRRKQPRSYGSPSPVSFIATTCPLSAHRPLTRLSSVPVRLGPRPRPHGALTVLQAAAAAAPAAAVSLSASPVTRFSARERRALAARNKAFQKLQTYREVTDEEIQELIAELQELVNLNNQKAHAIRQLMTMDLTVRVTYQTRITKVKEELEERIQELGRKSTQLRETVGYLDTMDAELIRTEEELEYHRQEAHRLRDLEAWVLVEYKDGEQQEAEPAPALKKPRRDDPFLRYFWGPGSEVHLEEYDRACAQRAQEEQETDQ
nr:unnamed protein product [Digitaria exilis]